MLRLPDIDRMAALREALAPRPAEVWVIRPDAHVAAVLTDPRAADVADALSRAVGTPTSL